MTSTAPLSPQDLVTRYGRLVSSVCRRMIRDPETARDAAQEAWAEILKGLPGFRGEARLSTWIFTVTRRAVMRAARREQVYSTRFLKDAFHGDTIPAPTEDRHMRGVWVRQMCDQCLTGILHCLDADTRLAYVLREIVELGYPELARVLGKDEPAVRQVVSRARARLRRFLTSECGLYAADGPCRCRMRPWVAEADLPAEYEKLRRVVHRARLYKESQAILPGPDWTEKIS
jgi:RNA polymerase sigma factor (sigma-70 family)